MSAEFFVGVVMAALAHEIEIEFSKYRRECIGVVGFKRHTFVRATLNFVTAGSGRTGLIRRPGGFEESLGAEFHGVGDFGRSKGRIFDDNGLQRNGSCIGPRKEKTDGPPAIEWMRTEESERIGMACGQQGIDLRFEARIGSG